jgi:hypothetical protein
MIHRLGNVAAAGKAATTTSTSTTEATEAALALTALASLSALTLTLASLSSLATLTLAALTTLAAVVATIVAAVVAAVATTVGDSESYTVILGTTLGDCHENRLMVAGRGHRAGTVNTGRKTISEVSTEKTLAVAGVVDTLEESKGLRIRGGLSVDVTLQILDSDMGVANNLSTLETLRSSVVGVVRVGKLASNQVVDLDRERHLLVGRNSIAVLRIGEDGRDHVLRRRNVAHDCAMVRK